MTDGSIYWRARRDAIEGTELYLESALWFARRAGDDPARIVDACVSFANLSAAYRELGLSRKAAALERLGLRLLRRVGERRVREWRDAR